MGRGGVDPDYFMHKMKWYEVRLFSDGMYEREHSGWMQNRRLIFWMLTGMGCKKDRSGTPLREEDIYPIPWMDNKPQEQEENYEERMRALLNSCQEYNEAQG